MKKYATVSNDKKSVVAVVFTGESATDENFSLFLDEVKQSYDYKNKIALIFDATNAVVPAFKYQKMQATWLKENEQMMIDYCAGTAYIIPNIVIRGVLKAIFTLQKQPAPYLVCSNATEAQNWVQKQLE